MSEFSFLLGKKISDRAKEIDEVIKKRLEAIAAAKGVTVAEIKKIILEADQPMDMDAIWDYLDSLEDQGLLGKGEDPED